jgi:DNA-binding CsgD family transcriptional regulator
VADGRSNKEIAAQLGLSPNTVKTHVARRTEAIGLARELGLVP